MADDDLVVTGGDCTHDGCVPSKALLETARRHLLLAERGPQPDGEEKA